MSSQKKLRQVFDRMAEVIKMDKIELIINNGDLMENPQNERGLTTKKGIATAGQIVNSFCEKTGVQMRLNAGNHELGYKLPLSTDPKGGMSLASIKGFQKLAGTADESLCRSFSYKGHRFVLVPFGLMQESAKDFDVEDFKIGILDDLLKEFMSQTEPGRKKVILFLHDPEALANDELYWIIQRYRSRIMHIFCGHWHAEWNFWPNWLLAKIFNNWWLYPADLIVRFIILLLSRSFWIAREVKGDYKRFKNVPTRIRESGVTIIPAPLGMLGLGGGFLVLDLETMEIQKY